MIQMFERSRGWKNGGTICGRAKTHTKGVVQLKLVGFVRGHSGHFLLDGFEAFDGGEIGLEDDVEFEAFVLAFVNVLLVLSFPRRDKGRVFRPGRKRYPRIVQHLQR